MLTETEDLKLRLDEAAQQISDAAVEIEDWEAWLVYFLGNLEMLAASLDPQHPDEYRAMLRRLRDDIEAKLQKGGWQNRIYLTTPIIRDYWS